MFDSNKHSMKTLGSIHVGVAINHQVISLVSTAGKNQLKF